MKKAYCYFGTLVIGITLLSTGCAPKIEAVRPTIAVIPPTQKVQPVAGSIWRGENDKSMLYTDKKAHYLDDIVTIIVSEASSGGNNAATNTSRDTNTAASITSLLGIETSIISGNANMNGTISVGGTNSNSLKGTGDTTRKGSLIARISARVVQVLDNGNLMIEGRRQVTVNAEDQFIVITGIIRPDDITWENTIASQYVADARIVYTGDGVINDKMRPGWLTRVVDWVWPF
jgi:flagellar L-ring protein FlgH